MKLKEFKKVEEIPVTTLNQFLKKFTINQIMYKINLKKKIEIEKIFLKSKIYYKTKQKRKIINIKLNLIILKLC